VDDDPLADRLALVLAGQVVVERPDLLVAEHGPCELRERVRQDDQRALRVPELAADVIRPVIGRMGACGGAVAVIDLG